MLLNFHLQQSRFDLTTSTTNQLFLKQQCHDVADPLGHHVSVNHCDVIKRKGLSRRQEAERPRRAKFRLERNATHGSL